jgi:hypothetical protein
MRAGIGDAGERRASRRERSLTELGVCVITLVGLGVAVFGSHVVHGGFYYDDWSNASGYHFDGFAWVLDKWHGIIPGRPILALLLALPHALFGVRSEFHLFLAIALGVLASTSFFAFLRTLGIEVGHALAIAALALVFPWSDSTRLWATASINNVALIAYFVGTVAVLHGLRTSGRGALLLHAVGSVLFVVSVLTYEVAAAAIALGGILYRGRAPAHRVARRWLADVALVVVLLIASLVLTAGVRPVGSLSQRASDIPRFTREGTSMLASAYLPRSFDSSGAKLLVLGLLAGILACALLRVRRSSAYAIRRWLARAGVAAVGVAAAYVMFLGSGLQPDYSGVDNRANTFAGFAFVTLVYSLTAAATLLVAGRSGRIATLILTLAFVVVSTGFIVRVRGDIHHFDEATVLQGDALARLRRALPAPEPGTTILTFGYPSQTAPGVPIFWAFWDLSGAVRLAWNDPSLVAIPQTAHERVVTCNHDSISTAEFPMKVPYGRIVFIDLASGSTKHVDSRRDCLRARRVFQPGPLIKP